MIDWSAAMVQRMEGLWKEGRSATECCDKLCREFPGNDFTRGSVLGKLHRLGLTGKRKPPAPKRAAAPPRLPDRGPPAVAPAPVIGPVHRADAFRDRPGSASWGDLRGGDHRCRWPLDAEDGSTSYCGAEVTEVTTSYCPFHNRLSWGRGTASERIAHRDSGAAA